MSDQDEAAERRESIRRAILQALPDGWEVRSADVEAGMSSPARGVIGCDWLIQSVRYDLGDYRLRLTSDSTTLVFVHSTNIHSFPPPIEEATLIRLDAFTTASLSTLLRELMTKRTPNLVHPT